METDFLPPSNAHSPDGLDPLAAMRWLAQAGVTTVLAETPQDRTQPIAPPQPAAKAQTPAPPRAGKPAKPAPASALAQVAAAEALAASCNTLDALKSAMDTFDGCALKSTATQLVFADGAAGSDIMVIGEAPGRDEDLAGKPFVGAAGQLLNKMLAAAQTPRDSVYITNIVPWRPPGNRKPTALETQICLPFIKRHIALAQPKALLLLGGTPANALTGKPDGITRLRGRLQTIEIGGKALPALPTFHPAYLLRQPAHKAFAWADMLALKEALAQSS